MRKAFFMIGDSSNLPNPVLLTNRESTSEFRILGDVYLCTVDDKADKKNFQTTRSLTACRKGPQNQS